MTPLEQLRYWSIVLEESKRTLFCRPEQETAVQEMVERLGMAGVYEVRGSDVVPEGRVIAADLNAMDAELREQLQDRRNWRRP